MFTSKASNKLSSQSLTFSKRKTQPLGRKNKYIGGMWMGQKYCESKLWLKWHCDRSEKKMSAEKRKSHKTKQKRTCRGILKTNKTLSSIQEVQLDCVLLDIEEREFQLNKKQACESFNLWFKEIVDNLYYCNTTEEETDNETLKNNIRYYYELKQEAVKYFKPRQDVYNDKNTIYMTYADDKLICNNIFF